MLRRRNRSWPAREHGIEVRFVRGNERKETIVAEILAQRGDSHGLVAILSALELCESFEPRYDKKFAGPREASPRNAIRAARSCALTAPKVEDAGRSSAASTSARTKTCTCSRSLFAGRTPSRASETGMFASTCVASRRPSLSDLKRL